MPGTHGERRARTYTGGLGAKPQRAPGEEPLVRVSGGEAPSPEAETFSVFECLKRSGNLALSGSFAVRAKPKFALCMASRAPKP